MSKALESVPDSVLQDILSNVQGTILSYTKI